MKRIVEYKLHGGEVPYFIEDGGYWVDPAFPHRLIGLTKDDEECHIPMSELTEYTGAGLIGKIVSRTMRKDGAGVDLTTQEKTDMVTSWLAARGK